MLRDVVNVGCDELDQAVDMLWRNLCVDDWIEQLKTDNQSSRTASTDRSK